ncbi:Protein RCR2 [Cytospora mali]|uniref:Congo red resistance-like protein 1 n=1 Tax=Cytospora mali TaxID=578113 RepID=A0A142GRJ6_CYTMA|nr:Congo red resistance-like protein 1 [Valsa mali var. pyri (nom. inval.)]KUI62070.1 Protein RCR2 [Valsa mali var. pyri (nom. inval.)]
MIIPEQLGGLLAPRQYSYSCPSGSYRSGNQCYSNTSSWNYWGRWVLAAIVIVFFISLFFCWSCLSNRRRRRRGAQPRYGTGWMMPGGPQSQQPQYGGGWFGHHKGANSNNPDPHPQPPPPPQYTPAPMDNQYTGQTFNSNEGYYGHHNNDIPLQQPTSSYQPRGGAPVYEPPAGPPPAKS